MAINYNLPPDPQNAVLKRVYPWDEYDATLTLQWLYTQAQKTGFLGTYEDFKQRYGIYIEAQTPEELQDLIDNYNGTYHIIPLLSVEQTLQTKNKLLNENIVIEPIPENLIVNKKTYSGVYAVTPTPLVDQVLRTEDRILEENIVVKQIPTHKVSNEAGGYTFTIG